MNRFSKKSDFDFAFEDLSATESLGSFGLVEVPLRNRVFVILGAWIVLVIAIVIGRVIFLGPFSYDDYSVRAKSNLEARKIDPAPRGVITDRNGVVLVDNAPSFLAFLRVKDFLAPTSDRQAIIEGISKIINLPTADIEAQIKEEVAKGKNQILLSEGLDESQIVAFETNPDLPVSVQSGFKRSYVGGPVFSSIVGYTGRVDAASLEKNPKLKNEFLVGKVGIEAYYDDYLRGVNGYRAERRDARGTALNQAESVPPVSGKTLKLTIDSDLQRYFYNRMLSGLQSLGRQSGAGLIMDPRNGEILAMVSLPTYDNNILSSPGRNKEKQEIFNSPSHPFFNRVISGFYSPGSTIKPLVAVAALKEKVITPQRTIYSPGYLDIPNPYNPSKPSRFLDWQPQGSVNVMSAIAQSSNVYFYQVGGGFGDIKGLGISRLLAWWDAFGLGRQTGVDFMSEAKGKLPEPDESQARRQRPWTLGDTYNVSIGQGDLLVTPIQLLNYTAAIANGGTLYRPHFSAEQEIKIMKDLTYLAPEIRWAQKGMELAVTSPRGSSYSLAKLPIKVAGKTGTAQINNNRAENAFFVGYAPIEKPEIAILVLVENAREGSLNALPIAKDVFEWYYLHKMGKEVSKTTKL